jgi:hypothetical protein
VVAEADFERDQFVRIGHIGHGQDRPSIPDLKIRIASALALE